VEEGGIPTITPVNTQQITKVHYAPPLTQTQQQLLFLLELMSPLPQQLVTLQLMQLAMKKVKRSWESSLLNEKMKNSLSKRGSIVKSIDKLASTITTDEANSAATALALAAASSNMMPMMFMMQMQMQQQQQQMQQAFMQSQMELQMKGCC
jgi:hypothetical protein